jgi:hypothetical protein
MQPKPDTFAEPEIVRQQFTESKSNRESLCNAEPELEFQLDAVCIARPVAGPIDYVFVLSVVVSIAACFKLPARVAFCQRHAVANTGCVGVFEPLAECICIVISVILAGFVTYSVAAGDSFRNDLAVDVGISDTVANAIRDMLEH